MTLVPQEMESLSQTLLELTPGFLNIVDEEQLSGAVELGAQISRHAKELDNQRLITTKGARDTVEAVNKLFNKKITELREAANQVVGAMQFYFREHKITKATGALGSTANMRDRYTWTVSDITQVPEEFLVPPDQRVQRKKMADLAKCQSVDEEGALTIEVPGIRFLPIAQLTLRAKSEIR